MKNMFIEVRDVCLLGTLTFITVSLTVLVLWAITLFSVEVATTLYRLM